MVKKKIVKKNQYFTKFKTNSPESKTLSVLVMSLPPSWQFTKDLKESMALIEREDSEQSTTLCSRGLGTNNYSVLWGLWLSEQMMISMGPPPSRQFTEGSESVYESTQNNQQLCSRGLRMINTMSMTLCSGHGSTIKLAVHWGLRICPWINDSLLWRTLNNQQLSALPESEWSTTLWISYGSTTYWPS